MARPKDLDRKPALLVAIIDYLLDKPLSGLSFRTLAEGLSVSTYTLVYHFGTRAELVREVVQAVSERQNYVVRTVDEETGLLEQHLENLRHSWRLSLDERSLQLQRLEFEAAMLESRELRTDRITLASFERWNRSGVDALVRMGVAVDDAEVEVRIIVVTLYGLHYDLLVTRDVERTTAAFERVLDHYARRIQDLMVVEQSRHG
ncbi:TetR/AcrR family transcriptional regulator [Lacisediminihabitans sp. FW035]